MRYSPGRREALWQAACSAAAAARSGCVRARDRPRAVRDATLKVLVEAGVLVMTLGGVLI